MPEVLPQKRLYTPPPPKNKKTKHKKTNKKNHTQAKDLRSQFKEMEANGSKNFRDVFNPLLRKRNANYNNNGTHLPG